MNKFIRLRNQTYNKNNKTESNEPKFMKTARLE